MAAWLKSLGLLCVASLLAFGGFAWKRKVDYDRLVRPSLQLGETASKQTVLNADESPGRAKQSLSSWNRFRGPNGSGYIAQSNAPLSWNQDENVGWQVELNGKGSSSPVLSESYVFVTTYTGEREDNGNMRDLTRYLSCYSRMNGELVWNCPFESRAFEDPFVGAGITEHGYATSTPVLSPDAVFVFLGKSGVAKVDFGGEIIWQKNVGNGSNPKGWGSTASPILFGNMVIVNAAEESSSIIALHQDDGREIWRAEGAKLPFTFSTPALVQTPDGQSELVIAVPGEVWGLNPNNGKLLWYAKSPIGGNVSPCMLTRGDHVVAFGGFRDTGSICIRAGGRGNVTNSHVVWQSKLTSYISTPVIVDGRAYWVDYQGKYFCQDIDTGELLARARMPSELEGGNPVYSSMVAAGDKLILQSRWSEVFILDASQPDLKVLHHNTLNDNSMSNATPALSDSQIFLRSNERLTCIQAD